MNVSFPILYPRLIDPRWFNADTPCDDDEELTKLEKAHEEYLNSIGRKPYFQKFPIGRADPEPSGGGIDSEEEVGSPATTSSTSGLGAGSHAATSISSESEQVFDPSEYEVVGVDWPAPAASTDSHPASGGESPVVTRMSVSEQVLDPGEYQVIGIGWMAPTNSELRPVDGAAATGGSSRPQMLVDGNVREGRYMGWGTPPTYDDSDSVSGHNEEETTEESDDEDEQEVYTLHSVIPIDSDSSEDLNETPGDAAGPGSHLTQ